MRSLRLSASDTPLATRSRSAGRCCIYFIERRSRTRRPSSYSPSGGRTRRQARVSSRISHPPAAPTRGVSKVRDWEHTLGIFSHGPRIPFPSALCTTRLAAATRALPRSVAATMRSPPYALRLMPLTELARGYWPLPAGPSTLRHPPHPAEFRLPPLRHVHEPVPPPLAPAPPSHYRSAAALSFEWSTSASTALPRSGPPACSKPSTSPPSACTFDVLQPDPRTGALAHIGTSRTRSTNIPRFPLTPRRPPPKPSRTKLSIAPPEALTPAQERKLLKEAEGRHVCGVCARAFDRASGLAIHVRSHSGLRRMFTFNTLHVSDQIG